MALISYDSSRVTVVIAGTLVQAPAPGNFITSDRDSPLFTSVSGTYGDVERVKNQNKSGTIKLTLQQTSPTNDLLSGFYEADEQTSTGLFLMLIRDLDSTTLAAMPKCWIEQIPTLERGDTVNNVVWSIKTDNLSQFIGGAFKVS
jgi:hypothetical protein